MSLFSRLGLALALLAALPAAHAAGLIRNAPAPKPETPLAARVDLDTPDSTRAFTLDNHFAFPAASDTASFAKITTQFGDIYVELLSADAPLSVANFQAYLTTDTTSADDLIKTYDGVFIHRSVPGFVIQTGGYKLRAATPPATGLSLLNVTKKIPVTNEFKVANTRGTLAFAKLGGQPNSATNEWFINLGDNRANLDNQNGGFTVFARVLGDGMTIADRIAALRTYDVDGDGSVFDTTPLTSPPPATGLTTSQFVILPTLRAVPASAVPASAKTLPVTYSILSNSRPRSATATLTGGVLTVGPGPLRGRSVVTVRAQAVGGHFLDTEVEVVRAGPPTIHAQLPGTTTAAFGTAFTLVAQTNVWPAGTIRWERKAPGSGTAFTPIAADDPLFSGEDTESLTLALDDATTPAATLAAMQGSQFRFVLTNSLGTVTSAPTKLKVTTQKVGFTAQPSALVTRNLGATATFTVAAQPVAANTPLTFRWQRLPAGQKNWLDLVNSTESAPTPFTGVTTATLTVKLDDLSLDGSQFRCVLRNALAEAAAPVAATGTATSTPSTLRIIAARRTLVTAESAPLFGLTAGEGITFSATGLPKGLVLDPLTGTLSGTPNAKPGFYRVTVTTRGPAGVSTRLYQIEILGLSGANTGSYEALLAAADQPPFAKLALTIATTGVFTGTLTTADDVAPLALRGSVVRSTTGLLTLAAPLVLNRPGTPAGRAYRLVDFQITSTGILTVGLESRATADGAFVPLAAARSVFVDGEQVGNPGVRLVTYSSSSTAPWSNVSAYNLAFTSPVDPAPDAARPFPAGSGYGLAPTRPDGRLNFKGKLADGSAFTASLLGAGDASFRLFLRPHGAAPGSVLSARLPLTIPRLDYPRHSIRGDDGLEAYWSKPALPKSANYRAGFGPLGLTVRLEPWFPRSFADFGFATTSNASRGRTLLSLDDTELGSSAGNLPDAVVVTFGNPIAFFADEVSANPARFTGLLDTRTGFLRGDFRLTDTVAGRSVSRTVPFEGTFLMSENLVGGTVTAEGFALVPALPGATPPTASSVRLRFRDPRTPPATP